MLPGLEFAGRHSSEFGIIVLRVEREPLPAARVATLTVTGRHGSWFYRAELEPRRFTVTLGIEHQEPEELVDQLYQLADWLAPTRGVAPLAFDIDPERYWLARVASVDPPERLAPDFVAVTVVFECPDPFAYAVEDDVLTITLAELYEGRPRYNSAAAYNQGARGRYNQLSTGQLVTRTFTRRGTAPSPPLITIEGRIEEGRGAVTVALNGATVTYRGPLSPGERLVIDGDHLTAYRESPSGRLPSLAGLSTLAVPVTVPGENSLAVVTTGAARVYQIEVACRSRWF